MDFAFTEEQEMLRASARELMAERYPIDRVAKIADGEGLDRSEWAVVAELGWPGISVPEEAGGAGLSFLEEAVVIEELGRALYPGPFFSTVVLGLEALRQAGYPEPMRAIAAGERIATVAWAGEDGRFDVDPAPKIQWDEQNDLMSGIRLFVPDVALADLLIVVGGFEGGTGIWIADLDSPGVRRRELPTVDGTRRMGQVVFENAHAWILAHGPGSGFLPLRDRALAALAVEAVGVASGALELALGHARDRQQFGRPIGSFQAVSHPLAQAFLEVETARSLAYWAAWAVAQDDPEAGRAAAAAKARAGEAAVATCERAIQVHGGIGFTWEHPLHRFYKRALGISAFMGWGGELRARVAADLLDERP
jgi:alkylation response protein AidB-like acyl-CoA dehydrogenase